MAEMTEMEKQTGEPEKNEGGSIVAGAFDWAEAFVRALVLVIVLLTFIFRIVSVDGSSMYPTLKDGEGVIISNLLYEPQKGDIIVIAQPNFTQKPIIKRLIATGGDTVDIRYETNEVLVNGEVIDEPYLVEAMTKQGDVQLPLTLKEGELFVMGDNRNGSTDSRSTLIGIIDERYVVGRVILRIFPINKLGTVA